MAHWSANQQETKSLKMGMELWKSGWLLVGNEGINLYIGILGMKLPSFPTKGQLDFGNFVVFSHHNG